MWVEPRSKKIKLPTFIVHRYDRDEIEDEIEERYASCQRKAETRNSPLHRKNKDDERQCPPAVEGRFVGR